MVFAALPEGGAAEGVTELLISQVKESEVMSACLGGLFEDHAAYRWGWMEDMTSDWVADLERCYLPAKKETQ